MVSEKFERVVLLSDHASVSLAQEVYKHLDKERIYGDVHEFNPDDLYINRFNDLETEVVLNTEVRGRHVFVIKSFSTIQKRFPYDYKSKVFSQKPQISDLVLDPDKAYMELLTINNALELSSVSGITNILPFMPYLRADKKSHSGEPITAKVVAKLTEASGANRIITVHPHFQQVQGFYNHAKFEILDSRVLFADWLIDNYSRDELAVIATDANSANFVEKIANDLHVPHGITYKSRNNPGSVKETRIMYDGSLEGKVAVIYDDMVDTGSSLANCAEYAKKKGAKEIIACMAHSILSGNAKEKLAQKGIKLVTTDSILIHDKDSYPNITVLSLGYLLAEAINCITSGKRIHQYLYNFEEFRKVKKAKCL